MSFVKETSTYKLNMRVGHKGKMNLPLLNSLTGIFFFSEVQSHPKRDFHSVVITMLPGCIKAVEYFDRFPLRT